MNKRDRLRARAVRIELNELTWPDEPPCQLAYDGVPLPASPERVHQALEDALGTLILERLSDVERIGWSSLGGGSPSDWHYWYYEKRALGGRPFTRSYTLGAARGRDEP